MKKTLTRGLPFAALLLVGAASVSAAPPSITGESNAEIAAANKILALPMTMEGAHADLTLINENNQKIRTNTEHGDKTATTATRIDDVSTLLTPGQTTTTNSLFNQAGNILEKLYTGDPIAGGDVKNIYDNLVAAVDTADPAVENLKAALTSVGEALKVDPVLDGNDSLKAQAVAIQAQVGDFTGGAGTISAELTTALAGDATVGSFQKGIATAILTKTSLDFKNKWGATDVAKADLIVLRDFIADIANWV